MNCKQFMEHLDDFVDNKLNELENEAMQAHADACPVCAAEAEKLRMLTEELSHLDDEVKAPEGLLRSTMERIRVQARLMYFRLSRFQVSLWRSAPSWLVGWQKGFTTNWKSLATVMSLPLISQSAAILPYVAQVNMKPFPRKLQTH